MKQMALLGSTLACALALAAPLAGAKAGNSGDTDPSGLDKQYLKTSMQGDLFEIRGGHLALSRSHNRAVVRLARRLVRDHSKSFNDSAKIARRFGIKVPKAPTASQIWELKMVATLHGRAFNHWYSSLEVYDHVQDISETTDEIDDGDVTAFRDDAKQELPVLREHLKLAREALRANR